MWIYVPTVLQVLFIKTGFENNLSLPNVAKNLIYVPKAMFRIKKDGRKNDGKNDRTSKLIQ